MSSRPEHEKLTAAQSEYALNLESMIQADKGDLIDIHSDFYNAIVLLDVVRRYFDGEKNNTELFDALAGIAKLLIINNGMLYDLIDEMELQA